MPPTTPVRAFLDDAHVDLASELESFVSERIDTLEVASDDGSARAQSRRLVEILGQDGVARHAVPAEGGTVDLRACCLVREALAGSSPLADSVFALQALGSMPIALAGSQDLRDRWLTAVAEGRAMAAFAMTEAEAGSDVGSMSTRAVRDGDDYLLDGAKHLITNAGVADFYTVFAKTDPRAGSRGISCFVVPAETPGLRFVRAQVLSEPHPLGEIAFESCRVPASHRLGAEGEGFKLGMRTLDRLRATVASAANGMAARALTEARSYATKRRQFDRPLSDQQLTQQKLARMATDLDAARLLTFRAAWVADHGADRVTREAAMAKLFATEAAQRIVDDAVQIHGGLGVVDDHIVDRLYRAVRALRIYEGASEVQHLVIAREVLRDG